MSRVRSVLPGCVLLGIGCVHTHMIPGNYEGRLVQGSCNLRFYRLPPQAPYEEVGYGSVSSGDSVSPDRAESELQRQACALGADTVVVTQESYGGRSGTLVRARYLKLKTEADPNARANVP
jgi:hypothetical protein